jgi:hypothetical protein
MHIQVVITAKLRRGESLVFTWTESTQRGSGRTTIWLSPASNIVYRFAGNRMATINRAWLAVLMDSANSPAGLFFTPEPDGSAPELARKAQR